MENNKPTTEQIQALVTFATANGRTWKSRRRSDLLQQLRNSFGPPWLVRFSLAKELEK